MQQISQTRLRYFEAIVECGSVRGAADKLDTAASVVSRQIRALEQQLGLPLFERRARGLVPTEAADMVLDFVRSYRAQHEHLADRLHALRGMQHGEVHLVISEGMVEILMQDVIGPFCRAYPNIRIGIQTESVNEVVEAVRRDRAHIGIAYNPPDHPEIRCRARVSMPVGLLVARDHPLASRRKPVPLAEAAGWPMALMTAPYGLRRIVDLLEFNEKIHLTPALTTNSLLVLKHYVMSGVGVALMTHIGAKREIDDGVLRLVPLDNQVLRAPECRLMVRLGRPLPQAANEVLRRIEAQMSAFAQQ